MPRLGLRKLHISGGRIIWSGKEPKAILLSFADVTERLRIERERGILLNSERAARAEAESANRAKDIFLATVSHELRTPLSSILTWAQLINKGMVDFEEAKAGAVVIERNARTQNQLIDDLLDISRIILGKLSLNIKEIDPSGAILSAIDSVRPLAEKKIHTF